MEKTAVSSIPYYQAGQLVVGYYLGFEPNAATFLGQGDPLKEYDFFAPLLPEGQKVANEGVVKLAGSAAAFFFTRRDIAVYSESDKSAAKICAERLAEQGEVDDTLAFLSLRAQTLVAVLQHQIDAVAKGLIAKPLLTVAEAIAIAFPPSKPAAAPAGAGVLAFPSTPANAGGGRPRT